MQLSFGDVLFKPNGRISQGQFWGGWAALVGANIVSGFIPFLGTLISIGLIYVGCCIYGKRLHDMGKTAWLHAIPWGVSIVCTFIAIGMMIPAIMEAAEMEGSASDEEIFMMMFSSMGPTALIFVVSGLIWLGYTIWVGASASQPAENKYGPVVGPSTVPNTFS